jgi:hypothetical protein
MTRIFDAATLNTFTEYFGMLNTANENADKERRKMMKGFASNDGVKKKEEKIEKPSSVAKPAKKSKLLNFLLGTMFTLVGSFTLYFVMKNKNRYFK